MPTNRKIQNIETPESHVPEVEVRWLASGPDFEYKPRDIVKLPQDSKLEWLLSVGWVEEI